MRRTFTFPIDKLRSMRSTARHPDLAALQARIPIAGRSVAMRGYWRDQPVDPRRMATHARADAMATMAVGAAALRHRLRRAADSMRAPVVTQARGWRGIANRTPATAAPAKIRETVDKAAAAVTERLPVKQAPPRRAARLPWFAAALTGALAGALAMFFADPQSGRRRRALVKDKVAHARRVVTRKIPRAAERRGRFLRGKLEGVRHEMQELTAVGVHQVTPDNETLVARVRSEVLRRPGIRPADVHFDAYEGCVTLRGLVDSGPAMKDLIEATRHVDGVVEVRSFLHLPGTLPPNKAESFAATENGAVPAHLAR